MRWHHWFRDTLGQPQARRVSRPRPPGRGRLRPRLEQCEDRTLLASYTAASVSDLINDINAANSGGGSNTITLAAKVMVFVPPAALAALMSLIRSERLAAV